MSEALTAALKDTERAIKKQKLCAAQSVTSVTALQDHVRSIQKQLAGAAPEAQAQALAQLRDGLAAQRKENAPAGPTKELHSAVSRLGKAIEKAFVADICRAPVSRGEMDQTALDRIIAAHLFQQGRFEIAESFAAEASLSCEEELRKPFSAMHSILKEIQARNLQPALEWVEARRGDLASAQQGYEAFEFQLHRLQFLNILTQQGSSEALKYIRRHNQRFYEHQASEAARLTCTVLWPGRGKLEASPYRDLAGASHWEDTAREFVRQCCGLMGLALESPLLVAVAAGSVAMPTLLKLADILQKQGQEVVIRDNCLPVEVELGNEFVFHSIFACPVSKDQSTRDNPPMLLPCGHVLCRVSISKISRSSSRSFKCPYCPSEASQSSCRQIHFPDIRT